MLRGKFALVAVALAMAAGPAFAEEGLGVSTQYAGDIASTTLDPTSTGSTPPSPYNVGGDCDFEGFTRGNGIQYAWGGRAASTSHDLNVPNSKIPTYTEATCTISSIKTDPNDPLPTQSISKTLGLPGPVTVVVDKDRALTPIWPLRTVEICIDGFAIFGPEDPVVRNIPHACKRSALLP